MVAWELTRNCNLNCVHCRAAASKGPHEGELTLSECKQVLDQIAGFASPTIILTGGEPLMRDDIFGIVDYGNAKGLRLVMAINGTLLTEEKAQRLKEYGIKRVSLSLDGKNARSMVEAVPADQYRAARRSFREPAAPERTSDWPPLWTGIFHRLAGRAHPRLDSTSPKSASPDSRSSARSFLHSSHLVYTEVSCSPGWLPMHRVAGPAY